MTVFGPCFSGSGGVKLTRSFSSVHTIAHINPRCFSSHYCNPQAMNDGMTVPSVLVRNNRVARCWRSLPVVAQLMTLRTNVNLFRRARHLT